MLGNLKKYLQSCPNTYLWLVAFLWVPVLLPGCSGPPGGMGTTPGGGGTLFIQLMGTASTPYTGLAFDPAFSTSDQWGLSGAVDPAGSNTPVAVTVARAEVAKLNLAEVTPGSIDVQESDGTATGYKMTYTTSVDPATMDTRYEGTVSTPAGLMVPFSATADQAFASSANQVRSVGPHTAATTQAIGPLAAAVVLALILASMWAVDQCRQVLVAANASCVMQATTTLKPAIDACIARNGFPEVQVVGGFFAANLKGGAVACTPMCHVDCKWNPCANGCPAG